VGRRERGELSAMATAREVGEHARAVAEARAVFEELRTEN
jgi:hypothetical protein